MGNWISSEETPSLDFSHNNGDFRDVLAKMTEADLARITSLNLGDCDLKSIPEDIFTLEMLEELDLSWNQIKDIRDLIGFRQLSVLNCSGNPLTSLPSEIGEMKELEILNACKAKITIIPSELSKLTNLKELSLFTNTIISVPQDFLQHMSSLTELNMACNQLEELPQDSFKDTVLLRRLALFSNRLHSLPTLKTLSKLEKLQLQGNRLSVIPEMGSHQNLTELDLSNNDLKSLPEKLFERENLPALLILQLTSNQLSSLPGNIGSLPVLTTLGLANNQLRELPPPIYRMQSLRHLDVSRNQFTSLPDEFSTLQYMLQSLYLSHNQFTGLPAVLSLFTSLRAFSVTGNPLDMKDPTTTEVYAAIRLNVADRKKGRFMGVSPADEITEAEYWKNAWGSYQSEWQGLL